jgi:hypothetical protein
MLFGEQIDELQISHPQETKWTPGRHELREQARLVSSSSLTIRFLAKHAAGWRRAALQKLFVKGHGLTKHPMMSF